MERYYNPNCEVVNMDRNKRMVCCATTLYQLDSKAAYWLGRPGALNDFLVCEKSNKLIAHQDDFNDALDAKERFMYLEEGQKWKPSEPDFNWDAYEVVTYKDPFDNIQKLLENKPPAKKEVLDKFKALAQNRAWESKETWESYDEDALEEILGVRSKDLEPMDEPEAFLDVHWAAMRHLIELHRRAREDDEYW